MTVAFFIGDNRIVARELPVTARPGTVSKPLRQLTRFFYGREAGRCEDESNGGNTGSSKS